MADEAKGAASEGVDERVKSLEEALSLEKAKNEVLMEQVLKSENTLAEKDLEGFADVIPNEDRAFWQGQLLENRENATGMLNRMRERVTPAPAAKAEAAPAAPAAPAAAAPKPMHNREAAPRPASAAGAPAASPADKAAKIRNRAQEISRLNGCSFTVAFRAAEQEFCATS
jgi:hypothetical protein